jgi:hypothetical protein
MDEIGSKSGYRATTVGDVMLGSGGARAPPAVFIDTRPADGIDDIPALPCDGPHVKVNRAGFVKAAIREEWSHSGRRCHSASEDNLLVSLFRYGLRHDLRAPVGGRLPGSCKGALVLVSSYATPDRLRRIGRARLAAWLRARHVRRVRPTESLNRASPTPMGRERVDR